MKKQHWFHANSARRAAAGCAVALHPFHRPPQLFEAVERFVAHLKPDGNEMFMVETDNLRRELRKLCQEFFEHDPIVSPWNERANGRQGNGYCSAFDRPAPEDDFIDLTALAWNVADCMWREYDHDMGGLEEPGCVSVREQGALPASFFRRLFPRLLGK